MVRRWMSLWLGLSLCVVQAAPEKSERLDFLLKEQAKVEKMIAEGQNDSELTSYLQEIKSEAEQITKELAQTEVKKEKPKEVVVAKPKKKKRKKKKAKRARRAKKIAPLLITHNVKVDGSQPLKEQLRQTLELLDRENDNLILLTEVAADSRARKVASANIAYLNGQKERILKSLKDQQKKQLSDFYYHGHLQMRYEAAENRQGVQGVRQSNDIFYRFRSYLTFSPNDKVSFNLTPQATKGLGNSENAGLIQHQFLSFFEANVNYQLMNRLFVKAGRQELSYGDHLIIGALPWANTGRSFDGIKFTKEHSRGSTDVMYAKVSDNGLTAGGYNVGNDDSNLVMVYNKMSFGPALKELDFYFFHRDDDASSPNEEVNTLGFRAKGAYHSFFYRTENAVQSGGNVGDDAFQYNVEVGGKYKKFKGSFEYAVAGADYIQMYPTAHKFLGFADVLGRRNVKHMALHLSGAVTNWLAIRADYHNFKREDTSEGAYKLLGTTSWGQTGTSDDIGDEVDVVLTFKTKDKLKLQVGGAWFSPGAYMKAQQIMDESTMFTYVQLLANF